MPNTPVGGPGSGAYAEHAYSAMSQHDESDPAADDDSNDLHAKGRVCGHCGTVIGANQPVRRLLKGGYVHDVCPVPQAG